MLVFILQLIQAVSIHFVFKKDRWISHLDRFLLQLPTQFQSCKRNTSWHFYRSVSVVQTKKKKKEIWQDNTLLRVLKISTPPSLLSYNLHFFLQYFKWSEVKWIMCHIQTVYKRLSSENNGDLEVPIVYKEFTLIDILPSICGFQ